MSDLTTSAAETGSRWIDGDTGEMRTTFAGGDVAPRRTAAVPHPRLWRIAQIGPWSFAELVLGSD
jgi:hypothetical protein